MVHSPPGDLEACTRRSVAAAREAVMMVNLHTRKEHVDVLVQLVSGTACRLAPR